VADDLCGLFDFCDEQEVQSIADAIYANPVLHERLQWILLDDCWAADNRSTNGSIQPDPTRFPSGIPALVEYLAERDLLLGLYTCVGDRTCKFNRTGSGGHFAQDAATFASWGVKYVKMDNCGAPSGEPPQEYVGNMSAYLNGTGVEMFFSSCQWGDGSPWSPSDPWGMALTQSYRISLDHLPIWSTVLAQRVLAFLRAGGAVSALDSVVPGLDTRRAVDVDQRLRALQRREGRAETGVLAVLDKMVARMGGKGSVGDNTVGQGTGDIIEIMSNISMYQQQYGYEDADFLETDLWFLTPQIDSIAEFTFWSLWGGNMLIATDVRNMTADKAFILQNQAAWDVALDTPTSPSFRVAKYADGGEVWYRDLANGDKAVVLFNPNDAGNITVPVAWAQVNWPATATVAGTDLWAATPVGPWHTATSALLGPHAVAYYRLNEQ
jgi:Alpha galactosidase A/Alpha galactosidase C-terminal beta sandwich domain